MKSGVLIICFFLTVSVAHAQVPNMPEAIPLEAGDIDKFIKTYAPVTKEIEELGKDLTTMRDPTILESLSANEQVQQILNKYGWDEQWMGKWISLSMSYGIVKMEQEVANLPADQREQYEQILASSTSQMRAMVTEQDIKLVEKRMKELDQVFEQDN